MAVHAYSLIPVTTAEHWSAYHEIRRKVLFDDRGLFGQYNANHPDDRKPNNHPVLLTCDAVPVGAMRIDIVDELNFAIMRTVAVATERQRQGHGQVMLSLAENFALQNGSSSVVVFAADDAVGFYTECGYQFEMWDATGAFGRGTQMRKQLSRP